MIRYLFSMFHALANLFNGVLKYFGFRIVNIKRLERLEQFKNLTKELNTNLTIERNGVLSIVFSKDRAMQLHAFLISYFEQIKNYAPVAILFKTSSEKHAQAYYELESIFLHYPVKFINETNFRQNLIDVVESSVSSRIVMYVDDMIFTHPFDYGVLSTINPYKSLLAFSRGKDMDFSVVLNKSLDLPTFTEEENGLLSFRWDEIKEFSDWNYPMGVSGYMYAKSELLGMLIFSNFKAPNSLEWSIYQFNNFFANRQGLCTEFAVSVCVHANLTQAESINIVVSDFSVENLLEKWNNNLCIDVHQFYNKPMEITQVQNYRFINRPTAPGYRTE